MTGRTLLAGSTGETHTDWWSTGGTTERESLPPTADQDDMADADWDLAYLYEAVEVPEGDFVYGTTESRVDFYVPPAGAYAGAAVPLRSALRFIKETSRYLARSEATEYIEAVMDLLESPVSNDRITLIEDTPDSWRDPDNHRADLLQALWKLYGVDPDKDMIRDDGLDIYGTKAWLAFSGTQTFVLTLRSEFVEVPDGEPGVVRILEAVKVSDNGDVWDLVLEPSLADVLRIEVMLDRYLASPEECEYVRYHANRDTVRRDLDVWELILEYRQQSKPRLSIDAQQALRLVFAPLIERRTVAVATSA